MPPNSQSTVIDKLGDDDDQTMEIEKFSGHFWSCDLKGMETLMDYMKNAYDELDQLHEIYLARAELEHAFGKKLEQLAKSSSISSNLNDNADNNDHGAVQKGIPGSIAAVHKELYKSAQSHFDFSKRLQESVSQDNQTWTKKQRGSLKKIKDSLMDLYEERQDTIGELYHVREVYQELDKHSPKRQTLQNDYRLLLNKTDSVLKQWNANWMEACDQIEQLEQDRVDFFTTNVWDYANLASARLMVQDEWCESIRTQLETCSFEEERDRCIRQAGVGKLVPTTSDYVTHFFSLQKEKHQQQPVAPRPNRTSTEPISKCLPSKPTPPQKEDDMSPLPPPSIRRKPVDQSSFKDKKVSAPMALEELLKKFENKKENGRQQQRSAHDSTSGTLPRYSSPPTTRSIATTKNVDYYQDTMEKDHGNRVSSQQQPGSDDEGNGNTTKRTTPPSTTYKNKPHTQTDQQSNTMNSQTSKQPKSSLHETSVTPAQPQAESTAESQQHTSPTLGRPKPMTPVPPKSPRPQAQQITTSTNNDSPTSLPSSYSQNGSPPSGSSRSMNFPPPINTSMNYNNQHQYQHQIPKSPIQQHVPASPNMMQQQQQQQQHMSSNTMMHSPMISNASSGTTSPLPMLYPSGPPPLNSGYQQAPHSPLMSGQQQPMYHHHQPPSSPMIQNQHMSYSPHPQHQMQAPPRSPSMMNTAPPRSPNLAPMGSQATPLSSPGTPAWNHTHQQAMGQHSPAISRSTSPFLSHPTSQQQVPSISRPHSPCIQRPTMLPDGTEILFWCQAMYDYTAQDPVELTFKAHTLFAVLYVAADGWWDAYAFDGHYFGLSGSIPSNYMRRL